MGHIQDRHRLRALQIERLNNKRQKSIKSPFDCHIPGIGEMVIAEDFYVGTLHDMLKAAKIRKP